MRSPDLNRKDGEERDEKRTGLRFRLREAVEPSRFHVGRTRSNHPLQGHIP
jgi:hypothetical protein